MSGECGHEHTGRAEHIHEPPAVPTSASHAQQSYAPAEHRLVVDDTGNMPTGPQGAVLLGTVVHRDGLDVVGSHGVGGDFSHDTNSVRRMGADNRPGHPLDQTGRQGRAVLGVGAGPLWDIRVSDDPQVGGSQEDIEHVRLGNGGQFSHVGTGFTDRRVSHTEATCAGSPSPTENGPATTSRYRAAGRNPSSEQRRPPSEWLSTAGTTRRRKHTVSMTTTDALVDWCCGSRVYVVYIYIYHVHATCFHRP